jgi:hypothetical protein
MPGARRTARSVLAVAVTVGAVLRELHACGRGLCRPSGGAEPRGSRPSGLGMPPALSRRGARLALAWSPRQLTLSLVVSRPASEPGQGRTIWRAEACP